MWWFWEKRENQLVTSQMANWHLAALSCSWRRGEVGSEKLVGTLAVPPIDLIRIDHSSLACSRIDDWIGSWMVVGQMRNRTGYRHSQIDH